MIDPRAPKWSSLTIGVLANVLLLSILAYAAALNAFDPNFYYVTVQEDEYLEWASFWAFIIAAAMCVAGSIRQRRVYGSIPWFFVGLGLFCFIVAMEEISWGQRLIGYRPPPYFLTHNYQQELNVHNVVDDSYRALAIRLIMLGYGALLPLAMLISRIGQFVNKVGILTPPVYLAPAFVIMFAAHVYYPWRFTAEWVELMLGLGLLFSALIRAIECRPLHNSPPSLSVRCAAVAGVWVLSLLLGAGSAAASRIQRSHSPTSVAMARVEISALKADFLSGLVRTECGIHKRLYTFVRDFDQTYLLRGRFSRLTSRRLPPERGEFFLDPWNSPYWVRDICSGINTRRIFVYSFGPNRRRDSSPWVLKGDDVGARLK